MSKAIRTVKGWAELPTNVKSQRQRKDVLRNWVLGNGLLSDMPDTHLLSPEEKNRVWSAVYDARSEAYPHFARKTSTWLRASTR